MEYLDRTIREMNKKFGENISEKQIATIIRGEYFIRDYLVDKKLGSDFRKSFFGAVPAPARIDETNWRILNTIANNARMGTVEIGKKVGISADAAADRIKKMEKTGVIRHYNFVPNESIYPFLHYKVLIGFRNSSEQRENDLVEYCMANPNIVYIVKALGPWEFEMDLEVVNAEQFREIMRNMKSRFHDIIKDYSTLHIYQVHKYNFCPSVQA